MLSGAPSCLFDPGRSGPYNQSLIMKLTVNGQSTDAPEAQSVRGLVHQLGLADRPVAVEVNARVVPRREHEQTQLSDGDEIEIVTLVGGG